MNAFSHAWSLLKDEKKPLMELDFGTPNKPLMELDFGGPEQQPQPAITMDWIDHNTMRQHPDKIFLFGDNHQRAGRGGQAKAMRGHPQAVGIRTKHAPSMRPSAMWTDDTYDENVRMIDEDINQALSHGKQIVIPSAGIGTGLARLPQNAPRTNQYLQSRLNALRGIE